MPASIPTAARPAVSPHPAAREGVEALESYSALSPEASNAEPDAVGTSRADFLGEPDHGFQLVVGRESVKDAVRRLPYRERALLHLRFPRPAAGRNSLPGGCETGHGGSSTTSCSPAAVRTS
ncbi:hypothetical protein [Streptomyces sp.]|uniref:hypothetical protein n=1 Tax=Streptomyces sp. TaxID=1931 RepID=UPI002D58EEFD|nr:hypothetical protein [Streptomyces sp.]HZF88524.1 hypothetical protein [Streptomyces sp.]